MSLEQRNSPKGLVRVTRRKATSDEAGFQLRETAPGTFDLVAGNPEDDVRQLIDEIERRSIDAIEKAGKDPAKVEELARESTEVDVACIAAMTLRKLKKCRHALAELETSCEPEAIRRLGFDAVLEALRAGVNLSSLFTVENEVAIIAREQSIQGARTGGRNKKDSAIERDIEMAREFRARMEKRPGSGGPSATAIKTAIGKKYDLKRSAAIAAIDQGLKHLNR